MYLGQTGDEGFPLSCHWLPGRRARFPPCHSFRELEESLTGQGWSEIPFSPSSPLSPCQGCRWGSAHPRSARLLCRLHRHSSLCSLATALQFVGLRGFADSKAREAVPAVSHLSGQPSPGNDSIPCQHSRPGRAHQPREQLGPCPYLSDLLTRRA